MKKITFLLLFFLVLSCSNDDDQETAQVTLSLKKATTNFANGGSGVFFEFNADGRPMQSTVYDFFYNTDNKLTRVERPGWGSPLKKEFEYVGDVLEAYTDQTNGSSDGVYTSQYDVVYTDNVVEHRTIDDSGQILFNVVHTYLTSNYEYIVKLEYYSIYEGPEAYEFYEYGYDVNNNLVLFSKQYYNDATAAHELQFTAYIAYDDKQNPYRVFNMLDPLVYGPEGHDFLGSTGRSLDPFIRRSTNNPTQIMFTAPGSTNTNSRFFNYTYNSEEYPLTMELYYETDLFKTVSYEYH